MTLIESIIVYVTLTTFVLYFGITLLLPYIERFLNSGKTKSKPKDKDLS